MARAKKETTAVTTTTAAPENLPVDWQAQVNARLQANKAKAEKAPTGNLTAIKFDHRKCAIVIGTQEGKEISGVLLSVQHERSWYENNYVEGSKDLPACFSFDKEAPHPASRNKQATDCRTCPQNAFGTKGKGKACQERARFVMVSAAALKTAESIAAAPLMIGSPSYFSSVELANYHDRLNDAGADGLFVQTNIAIVPDAKSFYRREFSPGPLVKGAKLQQALVARMDEADALLAKPYEAPAVVAPPPARGGKKERFAR